MSKSDGINGAAGGKEMKGLVAVAEMLADGSTNGSTDKPTSHDNNQIKSTTMSTAAASMSNTTEAPSTAPPSSGKGKVKDVTAARARRLEQNRRAAIESRRRKKVMIAELQRSVTFYTKANENLRMDNAELEQRLFHARNRVMQMKMGGVGAGKIMAPVVAAGLRAPPEHMKPKTEPNNVTSISSGTSQVDDQRPSNVHHEQQQPQQPIYPVASVPFPHLHPSVSPMQSDPAQAKAQLTATQAIYETMGYPSGAARVAANTFSQMVGLTGSTPSATKASAGDSTTSTDTAATTGHEMKPNAASLAVAPQIPSVEEVGSDKYVESLEKFAMEQTAAANAAAAAANAAIQALNYHKMMMKKSDGEAAAPQPATSMPFVTTISVPLTTSNGSTTTVTVPLATTLSSVPSSTAASTIAAATSNGNQKAASTKDGHEETPSKKHKS